MDLIQVRDYLAERGGAPLPDIAMHFQVDAATIRPLVDVWVRKGKARKLTGEAAGCKGCCKCDPATLESYEWLG